MSPETGLEIPDEVRRWRQMPEWRGAVRFRWSRSPERDPGFIHPLSVPVLPAPPEPLQIEWSVRTWSGLELLEGDWRQLAASRPLWLGDLWSSLEKAESRQQACAVVERGYPALIRLGRQALDNLRSHGAVCAEHWLHQQIGLWGLPQLEREWEIENEPRWQRGLSWRGRGLDPCRMFRHLAASRHVVWMESMFYEVLGGLGWTVRLENGCLEEIPEQIYESDFFRRFEDIDPWMRQIEDLISGL